MGEVDATTRSSLAVLSVVSVTSGPGQAVFGSKESYETQNAEIAGKDRGDRRGSV
jgi:hypothetical protein